MGLQNCLGKVDILYIIRHYLCVFRTFCADNILWRKNLNFEVIWDPIFPFTAASSRNFGKSQMRWHSKQLEKTSREEEAFKQLERRLLEKEKHSKEIRKLDTNFLDWDEVRRTSFGIQAKDSQEAKILVIISCSSWQELSEDGIVSHYDWQVLRILVPLELE